MVGGVELHQQLELFGEQLVVIGEIEAEQRKRFGENAASGDHFGAAAGDEVDGGEILEHATGSAVLRIVTALARRMRLVMAAIAANTTGVAAIAISNR